MANPYLDEYVQLQSRPQGIGRIAERIPDDSSREAFTATPEQLRTISQPYAFPGDAELPSWMEDPALKQYQPQPRPEAAPKLPVGLAAAEPLGSGAYAQMLAQQAASPSDWISGIKNQQRANQSSELDAILRKNLVYGLSPGEGNIPLSQLGEWGAGLSGTPHPTQGAAFPASGVSPNFSPYEIEALQGALGQEAPDLDALELTRGPR